MRKWLNVFLALVMSVMCSMTMVLPAYAAELPGVSVPVTISLSGTLPSPAEDFTVVLRADDADYPMPEGTVNGAYTMTIAGEGTENFPTIIYSRVGVYTYTVYQVAGSNKECTYDDAVYNLIVTVSNKTDYSGLEAAAVLYPDGEGDKLPSAEFKNEYEVVEPATPSEPPQTEDDPSTPANTPKTGDESALLLYVILILVSLGVIVSLLLTRKSKKTG